MRQVLPFHVLVDDDGMVRSVGSALFKLAGDLLDRPAFAALRIVKPRRLDPARALKDAFGERLTVEIP